MRGVATVQAESEGDGDARNHELNRTAPLYATVLDEDHPVGEDGASEIHPISDQ